MALRLLVEALELLARLGVVGIVAQDRLVLLDRLLRVCLPFGESPELARDRGLLFRAVLERALSRAEHVHQATVVAERATIFAIEREHRFVRRLDLRDARKP